MPKRGMYSDRYPTSLILPEIRGFLSSRQCNPFYVFVVRMWRVLYAQLEGSPSVTTAEHLQSR